MNSPRILGGTLVKKFLLVGTAAAAFCGAPAIAADMPVKAPVARAVPAPDLWTGCYIGANVGGAWAHKDTAETSGGGGPFFEPLGKTNVDGWAYGGQIGCDYKLNPTWVVGIRGMRDGSDLTGSNPWPPATGQPVENRYKVNEFATAVASIGYLVNPNLELYGLGGFAWAHDRLSWIATAAFRGAAVGTVLDIGSQSRTGYDVGAGLSWIFAPHWDLFVEYDHMGFGKKNINLSGLAGAFTVDVKQNVDKVLVGINYRFNLGGTAPVVAKY